MVCITELGLLNNMTLPLVSMAPCVAVWMTDCWFAWMTECTCVSDKRRSAVLIFSLNKIRGDGRCRDATYRRYNDGTAGTLRDERFDRTAGGGPVLFYHAVHNATEQSLRPAHVQQYVGVLTTTTTTAKPTLTIARLFVRGMIAAAMGHFVPNRGRSGAGARGHGLY